MVQADGGDPGTAPERAVPGVPVENPFVAAVPVMWPESGSGFEADPFSPAGSIQREGALFRGIARRRGGKVVLWIALGFVTLSLVAPLLIAVFRRH